MGEDHYAVLGVAPTATAAEIRARYLELVARYHPDRHGGNPLSDLATEKLARLNRAYETLSDPPRRAAYDARRAGEPSGAAPGTGWETGGASLGFSGAARTRKIVRAIGVFITLAILLRFGSLLVRALVRAAELFWQGIGALRGTPLLLVLFLLVLAGAVLLVARSVTRRRQD